MSNYHRNKNIIIILFCKVLSNAKCLSYKHLDTNKKEGGEFFSIEKYFRNYKLENDFYKKSNIPEKSKQ